MSTTQPRAEAMNLTTLRPKGPVPLNDVAVLLTPGDHVAIAKQPLLPGTILQLGDGHEVTGRADDPARAQGRARAGRRRTSRCAATARSSASPPRTSSRASTSTPRTCRSATGQPHARLRLQRGLPAGRAGAGGRAPHLHGVPAGGRPGRHAQLRRGAGLGQLLLVGDRARSPSTSASPACMDDYPNVDGVIALPAQGRLRRAHRLDATSHIFQRTLAGIVQHPNVGGYVILSPRLRGQPADRHDRVHRDGQGRAAGPHDPAGRRLPEDGRGGHRGGQGAAPAGQQGDPRGGPGLRADGRPPVRRLRRLVGRDRQPRTRQGRRPDRQAGRHGRARRDDRGLRRRAPADPPGEDAGGRRRS